MRPARTAERGQARILKFNGFGHFEKTHIFGIGTWPAPFDIMKVSLIKALGDTHFFFRRKIGLFPLRAIPQSCIVHQYFIFCLFPLSFKKNRCWVSLASVLNFGYFELILFRDQASYGEANYNVANYYFSNDDRVHSSNYCLFFYILIFPANFVNRNNFHNQIALQQRIF